MNHTPGPWESLERLSASENHHGFFITAPTHKPSQHRIKVAELVPMDAEGNEGRANATLIAAAPDMEDALEALITAYLTILGMSGLPVPNREALHKAQDALRKARGE